MKEKLTDTFLRALPPPPSGRLEIADLGCSGLAFRITENGARSWSFKFRDPGTTRPGRVKLGNYPDVSLKSARAVADEMRQRVAGGVNPSAQKKQDRAAAANRTFEALAKLYVAVVGDEKSDRFKRSAAQDEANLVRHVLPKWKGRRYDQITRADVIELLDGIMAAGTPIAANRVHSLISGVFGFAVDFDLLPFNPCVRLRKRGREHAGRRVLSDAELRLFWSGVVRSPVSLRTGQGLRFALLVGARIGEVAGARREEFVHLNDPDRAAWQIPEGRTKNDRSHYLPLAPPARAIVLALLELLPDDRQFLFPARSAAAAAMPSHSFTIAMRRFGESLSKEGDGVASWQAELPTPHDLRRTVRTRLAALGVTREDCDAIMNHSPRDVGGRHYDLYERAKEKRAALDRWAAALSAILKTPAGGSSNE